MRLLSWIFQPVYLIFFLIIAALYIYRQEVIPEHRGIEQSKALVARMAQTVAILEQEPIRSVSLNDAVRTEESGLKQSIEFEDNVNQQQPESDLPSVTAAPPIIAEDDAAIDPDGKAEATPEGEDRDVSEKPSDLLDTAGETESTDELEQVEPVKQPSSRLPQSLGTLWYEARRAARSGAMEQAIERYLQLTSDYPGSADGFGELGNVYYAMGDTSRALGAYQQALNIYQAGGYSGQSLQLQAVISKIQSK